MKRLLVLAAVIALTSCTNPEALTIADVMGLENAVAFTPPEAKGLWAVVESCSGLKGDFAKVRWYLDPDGVFFHGKPAGGIWIKEQNIIILSPPYVADSTMIEHEEMHALLRGGFDHPHQYFLDGPCGNLLGYVTTTTSG